MENVLNTISSRDAMIPEPWRISKVGRETADTFTIELAPMGNQAEFAFSPGQFNMLYQFGAGEVPISISGDPGKPKKLIHTIRAVGAVTRLMTGLKKGNVIGVRGPYGKGWPVEEAEGGDVVIAAGGIGLAPLRPALYHILSNRKKYGRVTLLYGARSPSDMIFSREISKWRARLDLDALFTVDRGAEGWRGAVGVVTTLIPKASFDPPNTTAMMCGPEIMMRFTVMEFLKLGVDAGKVFVSMERNMKCGIGLCGHCQIGPVFVCKDGPVFAYSAVRELMARREV